MGDDRPGDLFAGHAQRSRARTRRALVALALAMPLATVATGCAQTQCGAPTRTTYTCDPLPPGSEGCAPAETTWGPPPEVDPESRYAVGCEVLYPFCHGFYPDTVASCQCTMTAERTFYWSCPL